MGGTRWAIVLAVIIQVGALLAMALEREAIVLTGTRIWVRIAPVDPRDLLRGDYIDLEPEIAEVPRSLCRDGLAASPAIDSSVFASLVERDGVVEVVAASDRRPDSGLFLRGRLHHTVGDVRVVRYGIERFYIPEGSGKAIEERRRRPDGLQQPLELEVAVRGDGLAVPVGFRWCPLGISLTIDPPVAPPLDQRAAAPYTAVLRLANCSQDPVTVVASPSARAFRLEPANISVGVWRWVGNPAEDPPITTADLRTLVPGEELTLRFDLRHPRWFVAKNNGSPCSIADIDEWNGGFRLVYDPSTVAPTIAPSLWRGRLRTSRFSGWRTWD